MESRKLVFREVAIVAVGQLIGLTLMLGIYALLGFLDVSVLLGGVVGTMVAVGNFFFMAVVATVAADRAQNQDVAGGQKLIKGSYPVRLLALALVLVACGKSGYFDVLALVIPLVFVRPTLTVAEFFRNKREDV